jgi:hypothetical protein
MGAMVLDPELAEQIEQFVESWKVRGEKF